MRRPGRRTDLPPATPTGPVPLPFPKLAHGALRDTQLRRNLGKATATIRAKREQVVGELPDWQGLREAGRSIKERTLRHLDHYLEQLEASVERAGGQVHWARDAEEANRIVGALVAAAGATEVVKVKSMATEEIKLNEALAEMGINAVETDLAELIVQLGDDESSHILVPAIHKNRAEIRELFARTLDPSATAGLTDEPERLTEAARRHLRARFLSAKVAISGANFAIAETGGISVVESEGNGRMCLTLPETLITVMGIEKVIPTWQDLEVFLQLLPRSSTGERMNPYTSIWTGVTPGDGPRAFHLVLLDNGRTRVLSDPVGRQSLACIRCSACLNICPVYERVGGHAYASVYPGPIGAILTPMLAGEGRAGSLPYASSLCGACYEVCPVKINIPEILVHMRGKVVAGRRANPESTAMATLAKVFSSRRAYELAQKLGRAGARPLTRDGRIRRLPGALSGWTEARDAPAFPEQTFREWWQARLASRAPSAEAPPSPAAQSGGGGPASPTPEADR
jgi:L-lactate dehydrogenase complex protein LldF